MPNLFDQFDVESEVKDLATSFGVGANQLLEMGGGAYGLATGNMDNVVSRQGRENIDYLQRGKSKKLSDAETRRKAAVDAKSGIVDQALAYAKETFTDPRLLLSSTVEAIPSLVGAGGIGAGARAVTGRVLAKKGAQKAAETAAKVGVGTAVAAGSGMQGTSVGAEQYSEVTDILSKMSDEKAMAVPEIARLMSENGYSLEKAKKELTLGLARSTGALATIASLVTQIVPGGRTIEQALVGGGGKKVTGKALAQRGVGVVRGLLGEPIQEGSEEGSGAYLKNLDARAVEPERDLTKGVGEAIGAGVAGTALLSAAAGTSAASRPSRPVSEGETTAGKSSEPLASDATSIPVLEATTEYPSISLRDVENMSPEEFAATIDARDAVSRGAKPRPEDVTALEGMRRPPVAETDVSIAPVQEALDEWRTQNPDVGLSVTVINDPNMRNTRNYGIRGYFDPNTGEVVINSAFTKPFEVESVVNHEWSHHTLSSEEGRAALVEFATRDIPKEELDALAKRYPNADNLTLVEEWIARNQEKSPGTFARIIAKIREWLNGKLGINMTNEEVARVMLRTLRERGAPVAEGSGDMRQSTTDDPVGIPERRAEALRSFKERNPLSDATMESGRLYSPKVRDRLKTLSSTGVVDRAALDSDIETNFPAASRVEIPTEETLPTLDEIRNAVDEPKRSKVGGANNIPEGDLIVVRQEVPSYTRYGVGVVVVRDSKGNTYYQPMVRFTDPVLKPTPREENTALRIGSGESKIPTITVEGRMTSDQSMPPDLDTWTQVGYNPDRHSYMYDRETGDPILSGSEAVQIGNTVFVKDPEFGQRKDFKYSVEDEPLDTASENLNKTPNEATSIQQEEPRPARALPKSRFYVSSDERGGDFARAITEAARLHKKGAAVEVKPPEFYSDPENHLYFSEDGLAGAVVKPDGDLVSVFKHPDSTAKMRDILTDASQEATKLDGFDIDEFLPNYYSRFGFRPVARVTFNDEYAPPKWNFEENGRPDNVFMVRDPENKLGLPEYDAYSEVRDSVPLVSYEEALKLQQEAIDKVASEKPKGAVLASEKPSVSGQSNVLSPSSTDTVTMKPFKYSVEDEPKAGSKKAVRTPNEAVRKLSDDYNAQMGLGPIKHGHYVNFDEATARKIAKAYDAMPEIDRSPETVKAYEALAKEVNDQWDFAVENLGINFEPWTEDGQPYANSREMMEDVRNNNHLYFFRGGGKHEFMSQVDPETGLTSIDKLRAIHDLYGHAAEDYQFGPRGEENAWLKHSQMFSPEAQRALSVGTRGQNSWVNFGDQNYENGVNKNIPAKDRPYAPQKMALLPEELTDWRSALGKSEPERSSVLAKQPIRESVTEEPVSQDKKQTESTQFKNWFGDWQDPKAFTSRAKGPVSQVFKDGKPLVVYHATTKDFDSFESGRPTFDDMGFFGNVETNRHAIFFSDSPEQAGSYVVDSKGRADTGARTIPAYLDMKSPLYLNRNTNLDDLAEETGVNYNWLQNRRSWWELIDGEDGKMFVEGLKKAGYDGIVFEEDPIRPGVEVGTTYAVFEPTQVKSATGNRGTFDPTNTDIRYSVTEDPVDVADLPKNLMGDSEGFIPTYITKQNALPTVVGGKNKTVEIPVIDFSQYADKVFKAKGVSELKGKNITLAEAHVPVIQKYYAGLSPETYREKDVRAAADMVANDMSNNLLFLHDLALDTFGPEVVKRMSKWYDGANVIAKKFADEYGVSIEQSAAILATLSPQKHWFANVSLAENVMDVMRNHQDTVFDAAVEKAARASIKNSVGTTSSKRVLYEYIRAISGKKLSDLNILEEKTVFTRFLSQSIHPKLAYVVTPEGKLTPGSSVAVAWSGVPISSNSVNAFLDGSVNNLTVALGGGHKVRDFYGNIVDPMSPFFYTSDTHNVAASLLLPVGGTDFEVSHNFGGNPGVGEGPKLPVIGTTVTGLQGTYPLYLEAGRRAAEQRNVLPRQMQSITWEMIRIMFTDDMKTPAFMDSVKRVHDQVRSGGLDIDSARQNIIELSGGRDAIKARPPEWLNK